MVEISETSLIECPDCKREILDNVDYCRYCGHNFNEVVDESSGRISRFLKNPLRGAVINDLRYCINCKSEIRDFDMDFCDKCGSIIPYHRVKIFCPCGYVSFDSYCTICDQRGYKKRLTSEEFYQIWHNQVIVPLSKEYNTDLSRNEFKKYFNLTNEQVNHIIYKMVHRIIFDKIEGSIVEFFKTVLKETKDNYEDIEKAILKTVETNIKEIFDKEGLSSFNTATIKAEFTETIKTPHIQNKHGTGTKVLATAVAGPLGYVATSGVKQENETQKVYHKGEYFHSKVIITNNNVSYLTYSDQTSRGFSDTRSDITKVIFDWDDIKDFDDNMYFILNSGETFKCPNWRLTEIAKMAILDVIGSINTNLNKELFIKYNNISINKAKEVIIKSIKELIKSNKIKESNNVAISEFEALEKIMNMYKEGLLTDDEFTAMKQKFIGNTNEVINENNDVKTDDGNTPKFCKNCGAKLEENSNFCIGCGTKIK